MAGIKNFVLAGTYHYFLHLLCIGSECEICIKFLPQDQRNIFLCFCFITHKGNCKSVRSANPEVGQIIQAVFSCCGTIFCSRWYMCRRNRSAGHWSVLISNYTTNFRRGFLCKNLKRKK